MTEPGETEVARLVEAFEQMMAGEPGPWLALIADDVAWDLSAHPLPDVPDTGSGREAAAALWATYASGWSDYRASVREAIPSDGNVVVVVRERVRMGETEVPLERDLIYVWTVDAGQVTLVRVFKTVEDARRAIASDG